jgi:hypothetical protein
MDVTERANVWPPRAWLGGVLVVLFWPLNWTLPGVRTAYLFFPLIVDVLVQRRTGNSLWTRSRKQFVLLFVASAPVWWLFELVNGRTHNWEYVGGHLFTQFEYYLLCTVSFSVVMPAVFESAEWVRSFRWVERFASGPRVPATSWMCFTLLLTGLAMLVLVLLWPKLFYPFVWTSLAFILEPLNCWLGRQHFLAKLQHGDWRTVVSLSLGVLLCGFFWEMWNYYSFPKWIYHTPGAEFLRVFEMPLLGYGGYIPFALELYALKSFLWPSGPRLQL